MEPPNFSRGGKSFVTREIPRYTRDDKQRGHVFLTHVIPSLAADSELKIDERRVVRRNK